MYHFEMFASWCTMEISTVSIRGLGQVGGNETDLTEADARWNSS